MMLAFMDLRIYLHLVLIYLHMMEYCYQIIMFNQFAPLQEGLFLLADTQFI